MRPVRILAGCSALFCLIPAIVSAADLPRYALTVGRRLTYASQSHADYTTSSMESVGTLQITVAGQNADQSFRLIVRGASRSVRKRPGQPTTRAADASEEGEYTQVDLMPDGRVVAAEGGFNAEAPGTFPLLPADANELATTWKQEPKFPGMTDVFSAGEMTGGQWTFTSSSEGIFKRIYGIAIQQTFHFDLNKGIVTAI